MRVFTVFTADGSEDILYEPHELSVQIADSGALVLIGDGGSWSNAYAPGHWVATEDREHDGEAEEDDPPFDPVEVVRQHRKPRRSAVIE